MRSVLDSLVAHHDPRLVLLAVALCVFGAVTTMNVATRASGANSIKPWVWFLLLAVYSGSTVGATHFIAQLAFLVSVPATYQSGLTALAFIVGSAVMGFGLYLAVRGEPSRRDRMIGGGVMGAGVAALHYLGMAGVRIPGELSYSLVAVLGSVFVSVALGAAALPLALETSNPRTKSAAAMLVVLMVLGLHFIGMSGTVVELGLASEPQPSGVSRAILVMMVAMVSVFVLCTGMVGALLDQRESHRLAAEADRLRALADGAFEGIIVHRNGLVVDANAAARRMLRLSGRDVDLTTPVILDFLVSPPVARSTTAGTLEANIPRPDGSTFPAEIGRRSIVLTDGTQGEVFAIRDISESKAAEARIAHLALHDSLTGLPNRRFFRELVRKSMSAAQRSGQRAAVITLDINDFKNVNDVHGHPGGDEVLRVISNRIVATLRESDIAANFGGDEFAILQVGANQPKQAIALVERLTASLQRPIPVNHAEIVVSVSIGVALSPDDGTTPEELIRSADTAMHRAMEDNQTACLFFEPEMNDALIARRRIEGGLRRAVAEGGLTLVYQPIVDARTRAPVAFESLVRWRDPVLGNVMPDAFIPVAEETGLIVQIGEFVLRRACEDAARWPRNLRVAVNLSAVQFRRPGLVDLVRRTLRETGLPGDRLEIEITETLLIENRDQALRVLKELRGLGVRIAMDDFGTGYSSLSYLQSFPFDKIKIDRVFVSDIPGNAQNASIVGAVVAMGKSLGMRVVAEGVETETQAELLGRLECDEMQGYLIARPMPIENVDGFLTEYADVVKAIAAAAEARRPDPLGPIVAASEARDLRVAIRTNSGLMYEE